MIETDEALQQLLSLIDGSAGFGVGIRSYMDSDPNQQKIHAGCLELERRKKIYRHLEDGDMIIWMPVEKGKRVGIFKGAEIGIFEIDAPQDDTLKGIPESGVFKGPNRAPEKPIRFEI